jgi:hypothetical protein
MLTIDFKLENSLERFPPDSFRMTDIVDLNLQGLV